MTYQIRAEAEAKYPVNTSQGRDFKAWAKRIVYRHEKGDKTLMTCHIHCAFIALDIPLPGAAQ